jgi:hypothetical protein
MAMKGDGLILGEDKDLAQSRIEAIGKGKIDDAIDRAEANSGLGTIPGEGVEPFSPASCQDHGQDFLH